MRTLLSVILLLATTSSASAQVSCANPDDLCTGDPCVIDTLTVESPCVVGFGTRTVEIAGTLTVPDGGTLEIHAGEVRVTGRIAGRNTAGQGAMVSLFADPGRAEVRGTIDVRGIASGHVVVDGEAGATVDGKIRASGKGGAGGGVLVTSDGGNVLVLRTIDVRGTSGGFVRLIGPGPAVVPAYNVNLYGRVDARGGAGNGGALEMSGPWVALSENVDLRAKGGDGGTVSVFASKHMGIQSPVKIFASGSANGGAIELLTPPAESVPVLVNGKIDVRGIGGNGGPFTVSGPSSLVSFTGRADLRGAVTGGALGIDADVLDVSGARVRVGTGGELRLDHGSAAAVTVNGVFDARVNGVIEIAAPAASLTVSGTFFAGPAGCVGVSAGGTLDTTGLDSDVALAASCP
jgi:hypothetical protein